MTCAVCGAELRAGAMFCGECGARVTQGASASAAPVALAKPPISVPAPATPAAQPTVPIRPLATAAPVADALPPTAPPPVEPAVLSTPAPAAPAPLTIDDFEATILAPRRRPWVIAGPDGVAHPIRVPTVIGRAPQRPADRGDIEVLPLADPTKSLSKSHAVLELDGDGLTIEDLGSTNGIVIVDEHGTELMLPVGVRVPVVAGTRFELGDFVLVVDRG